MTQPTQPTQAIYVKHLALFSNGTLGLVTALQALRVTGEVITTLYSFVATAHSGIGCQQKSEQISSA